MAFTESQLRAQMDPANTGRTVSLQAFIPVGTGSTDVYVVGVSGDGNIGSRYAGKSRWVQLSQTLTDAQAWAAIQTALL